MRRLVSTWRRFWANRAGHGRRHGSDQGHDQERERDRGSGSVLAVGLLGATLAATAGVIPVLVTLSVSAQVQGAADAAALAAADTASGALPGVPCEAASRTAHVNGASLTACSLDGLIASVTLSREFVGIVLEARSRAGPPPGPQPESLGSLPRSPTGPP